MKLRELLEAAAGRTLFHYTNAYSFLLILEDGFLKTSGPFKFNKEKFEKEFGKDATRLYVTRPSYVPKNSLPMGLTGGVGPVRFIFDAQGISDNLRNTKINLLGGREEELIVRKKEKNIPLNEKYLKIELLPDFTEKIKGYIPVKMKLEEYRKRLKKVYPKWKHLIIDNKEKKKLEEFLNQTKA